MGYERNDRWSNDGGRRYGGGNRDWDRGSRPSGYNYEDRGFFDRAGDEVRSWFGDEEAERRRRYDERYDERNSGDRYADSYARRDERYGRDDYGFESGRRGNWADRGNSYGGRYGEGDRYSDDGARNYGSRGYQGYGSYGAAGGYGATGRSQGQAQGWGGDAGRSRDFGGQSRGTAGSHHDSNYQNWRDRQISALDRDYDDYRRENQTRFESEFSTYRSKRQGQRDLLGQVKEHAEVLGSDGQHVGTVDHVRGDRIKLTKTDQAAGGHHHTIPSSWIESVEDNRVTLSKTAEQARQAWREEQDDDDRSGGLFGRKSDDDNNSNKDWSTDRNLNRSFSGTY